MRTDRGRYTASVITRKAAMGGSSARETNRTFRVLRYRTLALPRSLNSRLPVGLNVNVQVLPLRSEEHTSELQSRRDLVCRLLLEKKNKQLHDKLASRVHG